MDENNKMQESQKIKDTEEEIRLKQEEEQFEAELAELMKPDQPGKRRKKRKQRVGRRWSGKRTVVMAAVVVLAAAGAFKVFGGKKEMPVMVGTAALTRGTIQSELTISGPVSGTDSVDVVSNLHAEVTEIQVKEGDRVEQGQLLAVIDDSDVRKEVDMAQNAYDLAVSTYNEQQLLAENGYAGAQQQLEAARREYDRTSVLYQSGSMSQLEWETARDKLREAERQVKTFTVENGRAVANESYALQMKNAEFELEKKKEQLEDTQVTSPIAGTVVRVNTKVGRFADKIEDNRMEREHR